MEAILSAENQSISMRKRKDGCCQPREQSTAEMRRDEISVERVPRARGLDQNNGISNCKLNTGYGKSNKMKTSGALQSIGEQRRKTESASSSKKKKAGKRLRASKAIVE